MKIDSPTAVPVLRLQTWTKIMLTTARNGVVPDTTSNVQPI